MANLLAKYDRRLEWRICVMDGTQEKSIQDFGGRNQKEGIFEDNINLDPDGGCRLYSCGSA